MCCYSDLNRAYAERAQRGFMQASAEILELFAQQRHGKLKNRPYNTLTRIRKSDSVYTKYLTQSLEKSIKSNS